MRRGARNQQNKGAQDPEAMPDGLFRRYTADTGRDFDLLLTRAEELLGVVVRDRRHLLVLRSLQFVVVLAPALLLAALSAPPAAAIALAPALAVAALVEKYAVRPASRRRSQRQTELTELVDGLREVFVHLATSELWPTSRTRQARSRLARFSVEERGGLW
ncbi:hypothetical protein ABS735_22335 [Streptomyces sp. MMCC 100]|uniref:hypothetical protein n=1 Tax=Streptomyces sp. MMCC 100 TaxID=3163555 RepID=UPI003596F327